MNLIHVIAFHRVASAGSFTAAATLTGVSQPTLSVQVKALEREMAARLFDRSGRRIRLTPAGERLFEATRGLAIAIEEVEVVVSGLRKEARGSLRVTTDSAIHVLPVLARLKQLSRGFRFSIRVSNSAEVIAEVLADTADVGVTARATADPRLHAIRVRDDRLVAMVASGDALAARRRLRMRDLEGRDLIVRERGSITREATEAMLARGLIRTGNVFDVATREAVREAVAAGFGYGVVFASEAGSDSRLVALDISDADITVSEFAICRAERRSLGLVARFLDMAQRVADESGWLAGRKAAR